MEFWMRLVSEYGPSCKQALELGIALFAQSTLILAAGLCTGWLLRRSSPASLRSLYRAVMASAEAAALIMLLLIGRVPALGSFTLPDLNPPTLPTASEATTPVLPPQAPEPPPTVPPALSSSQMPVPESATPSPPVPVSAPFPLTGVVYIGLAGIWLAGAGGMLLWTLLCYASVRQICRRSIAVTNPILLSELASLSVKAGIRSPVLLESADIVSPFVCGLSQPVLVVPTRMAQQSQIQALRAVFGHELAHIKSHDGVWMLAARLACALFWVQPLLWALSFCLEQASEEACDMTALGETSSRQEYARCLLDLAEQYRNGGAERVTGTGMALSRSSLSRRITRILYGPHYTGRTFSPLQSFALLVLFLGLSAGTSWFAAAQFARQTAPPPTFSPTTASGESFALTPPESPATEPEVNTVTVEQDVADQNARLAEADAVRAQGLMEHELAEAKNRQTDQLAQQKAEEQRLYEADLLLAQEAEIKAEQASLDQQIADAEQEVVEARRKYTDSRPILKERKMIAQELKVKRDSIQARLLLLKQKERKVGGSQQPNVSQQTDANRDRKWYADQLDLMKQITANLEQRRAQAENTLKEMRSKNPSDQSALQKAQQQATLLEKLTSEYKKRYEDLRQGKSRPGPAASVRNESRIKVMFGEEADVVELHGAEPKTDSAPTCVMEFLDKDGNLLRKHIYILRNRTVHASAQETTTVFSFNALTEARKDAPEDAVSIRYHYQSGEAAGKQFASDSRTLRLNPRPRLE